MATLVIQDFKITDDALTTLNDNGKLKPYDYFTGFRLSKDKKQYTGFTYNKNQYNVKYFVQEIVVQIYFNGTNNNLTYVFHVNDIGSEIPC